MDEEQKHVQFAKTFLVGWDNSLSNKQVWATFSPTFEPLPLQKWDEETTAQSLTKTATLVYPTSEGMPIHGAPSVVYAFPGR